MHPSESFLRDAQADVDRQDIVATIAAQFTADHVATVLTDGPELMQIYGDYEPDFWAQLARAFANVDRPDEISVRALREAVWNVRETFAAAVRKDYATRAIELAEEAV